MRLGVGIRADCGAGTLFYQCAANGFQGCCSVDACNYTDGCPDSAVHASEVTPATTPAATHTTTAQQEHTSTPSPPVSATSVADKLPQTSVTTPPTAPPTTPATSPAVPDPASIASTTGPSARPTAPAADGGQGTTSQGLSKGAIGGVVTAGVLAFVLLAALVLYKMHRKSRLLRPNTWQGPEGGPLAGAAAAAAGARLFPGAALSQTGSPLLGTEPGSLYGSPYVDQGVFEKDGLLVRAELAAAPPGAGTPLFAGHFQDPAAGPGAAPDGHGLRVVELDGQQVALAGLERPLSTPGATPLATPETDSHPRSATHWTHRAHPSPPTPGSGPGAAVDAPAGGAYMPTPESISVSRMSGMASEISAPSRQASAAEMPRPNLHISQSEEVRGIHVVSWGTYQP